MLTDVHLTENIAEYVHGANADPEKEWKKDGEQHYDVILSSSEIKTLPASSVLALRGFSQRNNEGESEEDEEEKESEESSCKKHKLEVRESDVRRTTNR